MKWDELCALFNALQNAPASMSSSYDFGELAYLKAIYISLVS